MNRITSKQLEVYDALEKFIKKNSFSPSFDEIAFLTRRGKTTVYQMCKSLKDKGYVDWKDGHSRTLKINKEVSEEERERLKMKLEYVF